MHHQPSIARRKSKAFVLLSTMLVILVLGLVVRVALLRMPAVLGSARHSLAGELAARAADSGLEYAVSQLREDPTWRGGTKDEEVVVDQAGLRVVQDNGNVIGTLHGPDGAVSEFRLRFHFQDGGPKDVGDGLPDPSLEFRFDTPFVSINNLDSDVEAVVPRARGNGFSVVDPSVGPYSTPEGSACLIVEGRSLRAGKVAARRTVESIYLFVPNRAVDDAVIMAGGGLDLEVSRRVYLGGRHIKMASDQRLRLRSKREVTARRDAEAAPLVLQRGTKAEIRYDEENTDLVAAFDRTTGNVTTADEGGADGQDFYNLPWAQIAKTDTKAVQIPGGTYVYGQALRPPSNKGEIRYFDLDYDQYREKSADYLKDPANSVVVEPDLASLRPKDNVEDAKVKIGNQAPKEPLSVRPVTLYTWNRVKKKAFPYAGFEFSITDRDLRVIPSKSGANGLAIVPRSLPMIDPDDTERPYPVVEDTFTPDSMKIELRSTTVTAIGDVQFRGGVLGSGGTVTSEGDITILAGRVMSMSAHSKGDAAVKEEFEALTLAGQAAEETPGAQKIPDDDGKDAALLLNLYAKGDLTLSTYVQKLGAYRNLAFKGLLYSWGNVKVSAGFAGEDARRGLFTLRGALVAYGNDPQSEKPGGMATAPGRVQITASSANLMWDPRFLPAIAELQPEGSSFFTLQRSMLSYPVK